MLGFLLRIALIGMLVYIVYVLATGGYNSVLSFYWWMHPLG